MSPPIHRTQSGQIPPYEGVEQRSGGSTSTHGRSPQGPQTGQQQSPQSGPQHQPPTKPTASGLSSSSVANMIAGQQSPGGAQKQSQPENVSNFERQGETIRRRYGKMGMLPIGAYMFNPYMMQRSGMPIFGKGSESQMQAYYESRGLPTNVAKQMATESPKSALANKELTSNLTRGQRATLEKLSGGSPQFQISQYVEQGVPRNIATKMVRENKSFSDPSIQQMITRAKADPTAIRDASERARAGIRKATEPTMKEVQLGSGSRLGQYFYGDQKSILRDTELASMRKFGDTTADKIQRGLGEGPIGDTAGLAARKTVHGATSLIEHAPIATAARWAPGALSGIGANMRMRRQLEYKQMSKEDPTNRAAKLAHGMGSISMGRSLLTMGGYGAMGLTGHKLYSASGMLAGGMGLGSGAAAGKAGLSGALAGAGGGMSLVGGAALFLPSLIGMIAGMKARSHQRKIRGQRKSADKSTRQHGGIADGYQNTLQSMLGQQPTTESLLTLLNYIQIESLRRVSVLPDMHAMIQHYVEDAKTKDAKTTQENVTTKLDERLDQEEKPRFFQKVSAIAGDYGGRFVHGMNKLRMADPITQLASFVMGGGTPKQMLDQSADAYLDSKARREMTGQIKELSEQTQFSYQEISAVNTKPEFYLQQAEDPMNKLISLQVGSYQLQTIQAKSLGAIASGLGMSEGVRQWGIDAKIPRAHWMHHVPIISSAITTVELAYKAGKGIWSALKFIKDAPQKAREGVSRIKDWTVDKVTKFVKGPVSDLDKDPNALLEKSGLVDKRTSAEKTEYFQDNLLDAALDQVSYLKKIEYILSTVSGLATDHISSLKHDKMTGKVMSQEEQHALNLERRDKLASAYDEEVSTFDKKWFGFRGKIRGKFSDKVDEMNYNRYGYTDLGKDATVNRALLSIMDPQQASEQEEAISSYRQSLKDKRKEFTPPKNPWDEFDPMKHNRYMNMQRDPNAIVLGGGDVNMAEYNESIAAGIEDARRYVDARYAREKDSLYRDLTTKVGLWAREEVGAGPSVIDPTDGIGERIGTGPDLPPNYGIGLDSTITAKVIDVNIVGVSGTSCMPICSCSDGTPININLSSINKVPVGQLLGIMSPDQMGMHSSMAALESTDDSMIIDVPFRPSPTGEPDLYKSLNLKTEDEILTAMQMPVPTSAIGTDSMVSSNPFSYVTGKRPDGQVIGDVDTSVSEEMAELEREKLVEQTENWRKAVTESDEYRNTLLEKIATGVGVTTVDGDEEQDDKKPGIFSKIFGGVFDFIKDKLIWVFGAAIFLFRKQLGRAFVWIGKKVGGLLLSFGKYIWGGIKNIGTIIGDLLINAGKKFVGFLAKGLGGLIGMIPGLGGIGESLSKWGGEQAATKLLGKQAGKEVAEQGTKAITETAGKEVTEKATKETAELATKEAGKQITKKVGTEVTEQVGKQVTKEVGEKVAKTGLKTVFKRIPAVGLLAGIGLGVYELSQGNFRSAGLEVASGAASLLDLVAPGVGVATGLAIDATNMGLQIKDVYDDADASKQPEDETSKVNDDQTSKIDLNHQGTALSMMHTGGIVKQDGPMNLQEGEYVMTKAETIELSGEMKRANRLSRDQLTATKDQTDTLKKIETTMDSSGWRGGNQPDQLNPRFLGRWNAATLEYRDLTGKTVQVNDDWRSYNRQVAMKAEKGKLAAAPGNSMHGFGFALDAQSRELNEMDKMGLLQKYGLTRPVRGETWHLEPIGLKRSQLRSAEHPSGKHPGIYYDSYLPGDPSQIQNVAVAEASKIKPDERDAPEDAVKNEGSLFDSLTNGLANIGNLFTDLLTPLTSGLGSLLGDNNLFGESKETPTADDGGFIKTSKDDKMVRIGPNMEEYFLPRTQGSMKLLATDIASEMDKHSPSDKILDLTKSFAKTLSNMVTMLTRATRMTWDVPTMPNRLSGSSVTEEAFNSISSGISSSTDGQHVTRPIPVSETYTDKTQQSALNRQIALAAANPQTQVAIPNLGRSVESARTGNERTIDPVSEKIIEQIFANTIVSFQQSIKVFAMGQNPFTIFR